MNTEEQSQDFEKLQHLLKLKRYEQPPPRYFNDFSGHVISAIRSDKSHRQTESVREFISRTPWLRRLWRTVEHQPAVAGTLATVACCLMVAGVFLTETKPQTLNNPFQGAVGGDGTLGNPGNLATVPALGHNLSASGGAPLLVSSTNLPSTLNGPNLFEQLANQPGPPVLINYKPQK